MPKSAAQTASIESLPSDGDDILDLDAVEVVKEPSAVFQLGGRTWHCRAKDDLHWDTIEKWMIAQGSGDATSIAVVMDELFAALLWPEEVDDFLALKRDPKGPLGAGRAGTLIEYLNEKVFGLTRSADPTERPAPSGRGSRKSGTGSKVKHDGRVTKPA